MKLQRDAKLLMLNQAVQIVEIGLQSNLVVRIINKGHISPSFLLCSQLWIRDYLFIGIGHYVQTLEPYWALPFWIINRSRENTGLSIWIIMRTRDLIYILIYILMKWLPIDFPHCNIKMFFYFYFFFRMALDSNPGSSDPEATELTTRPGRIVIQEIHFNRT